MMIFCLVAGLRGDGRVLLVPHLRAGQRFVYLIHGQVKRQVKTESRVTSMLDPGETASDASAEMRLRIVRVSGTPGKESVEAEAELVGSESKERGETRRALKFTIESDGEIANVKGAGELEAEQRMLWEFGMARFVNGWALPGNRLKRGEKWKSEELENAPSPIAQLVWERETEYVKNESCPVLTAEICAVLLTHSTLKQKSAEKDATPEDYRRRELRTAGTAKGTNETISYVSLKTGVLVRATEEAKQTMNVAIAKADGTNGVRYLVEAGSLMEMEIVPESPAKVR